MKAASFAFTFLLAIAGLAAADQPRLHIDGAFQVKDAAGYLYFRLTQQDIEGVMQPESAWLPLTAPVVQERFSGDRLWLRISLVNDKNFPANLVLVAGEARTDKTHFYLYQAGSLQSAHAGGDLITRNSRPDFLAARFAFTLAPNSEAQIFVLVENPVDLAADFTLLRDSAFAEFGGRTYLIQGIFFGAIMVLLLFYGAIYLSKRSRIVAAYFWYLVAAGVFFAARTGLLYQHVGYLSAEIMNVLVAPLPGVIYAAGIRFTRAFLELARGSTSDKILRTAQYVALVPVPLAFVSRHLTRDACDWLSLILGPGLLLYVWLIRREARKSNLFLLGWCWPILVSLLQYTGFDSSYLLRNVLLQAAMLVEFVLFAIFVGRDISRFEIERSQQSVNLLMLQEDLEQARRVHETLLPVGTPDFAGLAIAQLYRPMSELGGDYYDWFRLSEQRTVLIVADVTGHGLPAALDAAVVHIAFQTAVVEADDAAAILSAMNARLIAQGIDRCVSAVCAVYDHATKTCEIALAGHPQAIVVSGNRALPVGEYGPLLGFTHHSEYISSRVSLRAGDRLFLCTDGAYEIPESEADDEHIQFAEMLASKSHLPLAAALEATLEHFDALRQNKSSDDVTLLGAEVK
ncbi:SpoIIE family protein phosphatase [Turneriella parva]|uniref:Protein serine/threonine phosphatase n=1 Tax=Turneriella parva (strain ATCC BAA-1111 / DSM 21527 / NCTC 11395 / H) TaxID=869212 RepID=I4B5F5_TURPD|nr:SpoIIE family protein phosphatase [Turneriella parva]AFM12512.1 protein serine/threonine phosphatase [Turneriella parva DSM 21527]